MNLPKFISLRTKCLWVVGGLTVISRVAIALATGGIRSDISPDDWVFASIAVRDNWWTDCLRIMFIIGEAAIVGAIASVIIDFVTRRQRDSVGTG
jgi:hypothetical protein